MLAALNTYYLEQSQWRHKLSDEVWRRHQQELNSCRCQAHELAASMAGDVDLSALRGRGAEFVLGFTTIASIVFAALALGVLRILDNQQIGTLFAAIAGYVLGRTTTSRPSPQPQSGQATPSSPSSQGPVIQMPTEEQKKSA